MEEATPNGKIEGEGENQKLYSDAEKYWSGVPATVDGMLGGFSHISSTDIAGSVKFLNSFITPIGSRTQTTRAVDCGAGIGRITKRLLLPAFNTVDMVELNQDFLDAAKEHLGEEASRVERFICSGLQNFNPENGRYDVIWIQWVLGHLSDPDLVEFFKRCKSGVAEGGLIIVKENIAAGEEYEFDENDSSYTRPIDAYLTAFSEAGLDVIRQEKQKRFPKEIFDVYMFALK